MDGTEFGDRMKSFEVVDKKYLFKEQPVIIRVDGKAFHTYCKGFEKPYDMRLSKIMWQTAKYLCENIQNVEIAYTQSDEISLFLSAYKEEKTQLWFGGNVEKMVSISAGMAVVGFNQERLKGDLCRTWALFDSRAYNVPKDEVINYFIWRQKDCMRNFVQAVARNHFSQRQLNNQNVPAMKKMLEEKGVNLSDYPDAYARGVCFYRTQRDIPVDWDEIEREKGITLPDHIKKEKVALRSFYEFDEHVPYFTDEREYIGRFV